MSLVIYAEGMTEQQAAQLINPWFISRPKKPCEHCTACCTKVSVEEIAKPAFQPCKFLCGSGCSVYPTRPLSCSEFHCGYLLFDFLPDWARPDRSGIMFSPGTIGLGTAAGNIKIMVIQGHVDDPEVFGRNEVQHLIKEVIKRFPFLFVGYVSGRKDIYVYNVLSDPDLRGALARNELVHILYEKKEAA